MSDNGWDDDDEVGYGRPPKKSRFQRGVSGNPSGRPKKPQDINEVLLRELDMKVVVNDGGKSARLTKRNVIDKVLIQKAMKGDLAAVRILYAFHREALEKLAAASEKQEAELQRMQNVKSMSTVELAMAVLKDPEIKQIHDERERKRKAATNLPQNETKKRSGGSE